MLGKILTTEPPDISAENFEELLATDDLLVHYFNEFLSLPVFYVALTFNKNTRVFEELTDAAESLTQRIRATLREYKSKLLSDRAESPFSPMCDNTYTVLCLDREQGAEWIKRERLPLFLQSDYYFEYRLAKLLSQVDSTCLDGKLEVDPTYSPWAVTTEDRPAPVPGQCEHKPLPQGSVKYSRDWSPSASHTQTSSLSTQSSPQFPCSDSEGSLPTLSPRTAGSSSQLGSPRPEHQHPPSPGGKCSGMEQPQSPHEFYLTNTRLPGPLHGVSTPLTSPSTTVEHFADSLVKQVIRDAILEMEEDSQCANEGTGSKSPALRQQTVAQRSQSVQPHPEHAQRGEEPEESEPESDTGEPDTDLCGIQGNKNGLKDFKSFLRGTPGEKLFNLWMDIQRLQSLQNSNSKNRHLMRMRSWYMLSSGQSALSAEVLSRLGLASTPCWREAKLRHVQPRLIEALLLYWCPRFLRAERAGEESISASLRLLQERQLRPPSGIDPNPRTITLLPLRPSSCFPRIAPTNSLQSLAVVPASPVHMGSKRASLRPHTQGGVKASLQPAWDAPFSAPTMHWAPMNRAQSKSRKPSLKDGPNSLCMDRGTAPSPGWLEADGSCSPFLGGRRMEQMLQSLQSEPKSGFYFTHFCEGSQNQLWESGIHFWADLQEYHQLFYQDGLDPYRLQQQAQLLYATYLCPGARMSIGLDEESRRQVYMCLTPPFEELFDSAEEHVLALLLQPWTLLMDRDRAVYERVDLWEETRHVGTAHYRKLQALHRKLLRRLNQNAPVHSPPPPPEIPSEPDLWLQVPEQFRSYRLGSLLRHRLELQQFHSFLEENFASMDLLCWLDLEQYKRLPQKDRAQREERCRDIRSRYLSRRYFFGPNSPASREQQEEVIGQAGGWGRILQGRLSARVLTEVQGHAKRRIERKWLPLFLATPQFMERQKVKSQVEDVVEDQIFLRHRKKREVWKHVDSTWMASSKEILAFRRALLNPLTCQQFQRFVSLKGDFLENGVLFWLEVQRYKDLFHSHCDEATVQHKVTLIISSFIDSPLPPGLQINIPPEQARDILERRREMGPYVFREAQMTVFTQLFKLWPQFLSFRSSVEEERVLPELEVRKEKQRQKLHRRRREEEERRAQEEAEKQKSSFAEGLFEDGCSVFGGSQEGGEIGGESGAPTHPAQQVSWSYSRYISALEQEEALLQTHLERGVATLSVSSGTVSSRRSVRSEGRGSTCSQRRVPSSRAQSVQQ